MNKDLFIKMVSKIDQTCEDEFKAEYNSPELIWKKIICKLTAQSPVICTCSEDNLIVGLDGCRCERCGIEILSRKFSQSINSELIEACKAALSVFDSENFYGKTRKKLEYAIKNATESPFS